MDVPKYDPNAILQAAENKRVQNDLEGAHMMFESALLEWVDDAREGAGDPDQMREAIATLWLAYADFHKSNKMVSKLPRERGRGKERGKPFERCAQEGIDAVIKQGKIQ